MTAHLQSAKARPAEPSVIVIFGATGDLTRRLLLPALYNLATAKLLPDAFAIIGVARSQNSDAGFRSDIEHALAEFGMQKIKTEASRWLRDRSSYVSGNFDDPATYKSLAEHLGEIEDQRGTVGNRIFYLAVPPGVVTRVTRNLAEAGLTREDSGAWRRLVIEKPFGTDLASAQALNRELREVFEERQIYRIDHYLGKETVQNVMVLRFANGLFEPLWNRDHIDHVQITVAETVSVENRGAFYDVTGALRDMVPNHLFQLMTLTAMEPPIRFDADAVRTEKGKVLDAVQRYQPATAVENVVRGQYTGGSVNGREVVGYRQAPNVARDSSAETYVAMRLQIDNWRWAGVPFYLRTGKALAARKTHIAIKFKEPPFAMFRDTPVNRLTENYLVIRIQPEEGAALEFNAKVPGQKLTIDGVRMDFRYKDYFDRMPNTGYETLIYDCMAGDATLFQRADEVEAGWSVVQPILDAWGASRRGEPETYPAGSSGPAAAETLLTREGRTWRPIN
jgi:glucose-6-phosphate 1-dehydrogenase